MHYHDHDVLALTRAAPLLALGKPRAGLRLLRRAVETAERLDWALRRYPELRVEPLDFHYITLQSLGALNARLFADLLTAYGWRGVVWGAWLATLAPDPAWRAPLLAARPRVPHNSWIVDLALAGIGDAAAAELDEATALVAALRAALAPLPRPRVLLRPAPDLPAVAAQRDVVRAAYRAGGRAAALAVISATPRR